MKAALAAVLLLPSFLGPDPQDGPPKPDLYLYYQTNFLVDKNVDVAQEIWSRAAKAGYTKVVVADSKMSKLGDMDKRYFKTLDRARKIADDLKMELIPCVFGVGYSNGMLW